VDARSAFDVQRLEREVRDLREHATALELAATQESEHLQASVRGERWRGWTFVGAGLGLIAATALAMPVESLFTVSPDDPNCHIPSLERLKSRGHELDGLTGPGSAQGNEVEQ
jgi:hypothetical protein